jgi:hypothetical protein
MNVDLSVEEMQHLLAFLNGTTDIGCEMCDELRAKFAVSIHDAKCEVPERLKKLGVVSIEHETVLNGN